MPFLNRKNLKAIGPGIVVAATGLGAGDMIAAAVGGANYGLALIWAIILGAILKFYLNLGIAKWHLYASESLISGWRKHLHIAFTWYFIFYLILWSFIVSGALISATGLAAYSIFKQPGIAFWGIVHACIAFVIVYFNKYALLEKLMKFFIGFMFLTVIVSAVLMKPDMKSLLQSLVQFSFPEGSTKLILGIVGGVGGSVTLLSYGYWINEKGWKGKADFNKAKTDLSVAYVLTALFGVSMLIIASKIGATAITGTDLIIKISDELFLVSGAVGKYVFLVGFWGAVFSSLVGVFQGVPYLFEDVVNNYRHTKSEKTGERSKLYKGFLIYLFIPPIILLFLTKPVWMVILYAVVGAFFMPFLAFTLLWLLNFSKAGKNHLLINIFLVLNILLFLLLLIFELV